MPAYRAKKRLGQNFLKSKAIIDRVLGLLSLSPDDSVVEIGPGQGALTLPLAASGAHVWAVEFDRDLMPYLYSLLADYPNISLVNGDFLEFDPVAGRLDRFKLVGNLPYNITSPVIDWCLKYRDRIECAVLMVQRELGARIAGSPGSKDWSPLSIFTQSVFRVEKCFDVAPSHFTPLPKVTSTVLRLTPHEKPLVLDSAPFEKVVRASFRHRRKLLANNLVPEIIPDSRTAAEVMRQTGMGEKTRAEEVTIEQFLKLTTTLVDRKLI